MFYCACYFRYDGVPEFYCINDVGSEVRRRLGVVFVLVNRSRRVVPDELVTLTSWDARDFLIFLVMVGWKGKDAVMDAVVAFSCLLNCLRVSLSLMLSNIDDI